MGNPPNKPSLEEHLVHAGWMHGLARGIVGDSALAEDVVQDTWVAALDRPPDHGSRAPWPAWLRGVVINLAHNRRRRERERGAVERLAARPEASAGDAQALERLQLQRELSEHILQLHEPNRSAVIQRYVEGLGAEAIGKRCGCSPQAARQRVARGLAELRARLQAGKAQGGRDWLPALCALSNIAAISNTPWPVVGVTVMSKSGWTLASVGVGILAGFVLWSGLERRPAVSSGSSAPSSALESSPPQPEVRVQAPQVAGDVPNSGRAASAPPAVATVTNLIVCDVQARPIEGASVRPRGSPTHGDTTDRQGRFQLRSEQAATPGASLRANVSHEDFLDLDVDLEPGQTREVVLKRKPQVEITLRIPAALAGGVLKPPWSGSVWVRQPDSGEVSQVRAEFEADSTGGGRLLAKRLPLGRLERAEGRAGGFATGAAAFALELEPEALHQVELDLVAGMRVVGRVVDASTRDPIPRAVVWAEDFFFSAETTFNWITADEHGRFELSGLESQRVGAPANRPDMEPRWVQVSAKADGYQGKQFEGRVLQANAAGEYELELELHRSDCRLRGRVIGVEGLSSPLLVTAAQSDGQMRMVYVDARGGFELDQLVPGVTWLFITNSHTFDRREPGHSDPRACARANVALGPGETKDIELSLERGSAKLSGRVLDARGRPIAGIPVQAHMNETLGMLAWGAFHWLTESAQDGSFAFQGMPSGSYALEFGTLPDAWCELESQWRCKLAQGEARDDARLVLAECSSVAGSVELGTLDPALLRVEARGPGDSAFPSESPVAADASFHLARLPAIDLEIVLLRKSGEELARVPIGPRGARALILRPKL